MLSSVAAELDSVRGKSSSMDFPTEMPDDGDADDGDGDAGDGDDDAFTTK